MDKSLYQTEYPPKTVYLALAYHSDRSRAYILGAAYSEQAVYALIGQDAISCMLVNYRVLALSVGALKHLSVFPIDEEEEEE